MPTSGAFEPHGWSEENACFTPARSALANGRTRIDSSVARSGAAAPPRSQRNDGCATTQTPRSAMRAISSAVRKIA